MIGSSAQRKSTVNIPIAEKLEKELKKKVYSLNAIAKGYNSTSRYWSRASLLIVSSFAKSLIDLNHLASIQSTESARLMFPNRVYILCLV